MKKFFNWQMMIAAILMALSAFFYFIHYLIFRDMHHIFLYLIGDIAFLFVDVLIVMLVLHRLLEYREKKAILRKLNMVIGTFFIEVGTGLLRKCAQLDPEMARDASRLMVSTNWSDKEFLRARQVVQGWQRKITINANDLGAIKRFLIGQRPFLLHLLGNPNLLEHESFTDLLWAVFHLTDELAHRQDLARLPETDYQHLAGDIKRAYQQLIVQWLDYMRHLRQDYPYLFSLALRTNPFADNVSVEVK